jgi:hypothetical protein
VLEPRVRVGTERAIFNTEHRPATQILDAAATRL